MKAVIAGGGIGGLASALALTRHGWEVEVLERAAAFTEAGAGLSLWPNGLRALDASVWASRSGSEPCWRARPASGTLPGGGCPAPTPPRWSAATGPQP